MNRRRILPSLLTALVLLAPPAAHAQQTGPQPELAKQPLVIVTRDGVHHPFSVEVANTIDQQETGLMFRPVVPADGGMLFDWGWVRDSDMWMKNTISSLDMLFIDPDGHVHHIAERTTPRSLAVISSDGPVRATLELAAGTAERLDIRVGDLVETPVLGNLH